MTIADLDRSPDEDREIPGVHMLSLEITRRCCLRCEYCFMHEKPGKSDMELETGKAAVDWLIRNSGNRRRLRLNFFGGEPFVVYDLIQGLVYYASARAEEFDKSIATGCTTNMVLADQDVVNFAKQNGLSFHTSIDGLPWVQDKYRRFPDGSGSSAIVVERAKNILKAFPNTTARATVCPDTCEAMYDSIVFLSELGYKSFAFEPAPELDWSQRSLRTFDTQLEKVSDFFVERFRRGAPISVHQLDGAIRSIARPDPPEHHCGAGRGYLAVDCSGAIWPCHRFSGYNLPVEECVLGTVFDQGLTNSEARQEFIDYDPRKHSKADCEHCIATHWCGTCCVALSYSVHGEFGLPVGEYCELHQIAFRNALRAHYILRKEGNKTFMEKYYKKNRGTERELDRAVPRAKVGVCTTGFSRSPAV